MPSRASAITAAATAASAIGATPRWKRVVPLNDPVPAMVPVVGESISDTPFFGTAAAPVSSACAEYNEVVKRWLAAATHGDAGNKPALNISAPRQESRASRRSHRHAPHASLVARDRPRTRAAAQER